MTCLLQEIVTAGLWCDFAVFFSCGAACLELTHYNLTLLNTSVARRPHECFWAHSHRTAGHLMRDSANWRTALGPAGQGGSSVFRTLWPRGDSVAKPVQCNHDIVRVYTAPFMSSVIAHSPHASLPVDAAEQADQPMHGRSSRRCPGSGCAQQ